jgi:large subunit ribosomal protein L18
MAESSGYCAPYRRRREGKTDYRARKAFILSGKPRVVIRGTLKNITAQIIVAKQKGDEVIVSAHSRELAGKFGWKTSRANLPAAYLTGLLCGLKAKTKGLEEVISDIGLHSPTKGARIFAVLKGVVDAGVDVPHSEEKVPDEKRMDGDHVAKYAKSLTSDPEDYQAKFSKYIAQQLSPENLPENFAEVKKNIVNAFQGGGKKT